MLHSIFSTLYELVHNLAKEHAYDGLISILLQANVTRESQQSISFR